MHIPGHQALDFVRAVFVRHFGGHDTGFLEKVFAAAQDLFEGRYPGYQASDTAYHDFKHTCEATVAVVRILDGHLKGKTPPAIGHREFELTVAATLLHDSGFMKKSGDDSGTGAKYTLEHVKRSGDFAEECLGALRASPEEVQLVRLAIDCTGIQVRVEDLPFRNEQERFLGCALGTGDMLGQMAAPDYPQRLGSLYREFAEAAAAHAGGTDSWIAGYASEEDLKRKTRRFYEGYVREMLDKHWGGAYRDLDHHFQDGKNHYLEAIEANLERIERELATA